MSDTQTTQVVTPSVTPPPSGTQAQAGNYLSSEPIDATTIAPNKVELAYNPADYTPEGTKIERAETSTASNEVVNETAATATTSPKEAQERAHKLAQLAKLERKVAAEKKEAQAMIEQAKAYQEAFKSTNLVESLEKLGLKPNEIYRALTEQALKEPEKPKDPVQLKLEEQEAKLKSYEDAQKAMQQELQNERETAAHMQAISQYVAPVINANPDKYEVLLDIYGGKENAIREIYTQMYNEYINSGTQVTAEQAADLMEKHWSEQMEMAIGKAKAKKKFAHYFRDEKAEAEAAVKAKIEQETTTNRSLSHAERLLSVLAEHKKETPQVELETVEPPKTLTNNMNFATSIGPASPFTDRKAQIAAFLKKNA